MVRNIFSRKRKVSIFALFTITMVFLILVTVGLNWLMNHFFLETYYIYNKQNTILNGYDEINEACADGILEEESFDVPFQKICSNGNLGILIVQANSMTPYSEFPGAANLFRYNRILRSSYTDESEAWMQFSGLLTTTEGDSSHILTQTSDYVLERLEDSRMDAEYLVLIGTLTDGSRIFMKTALQSISESAAISNRFSVMTGVIAIVICAVLSLFLANVLANPMQQLNRLSRRMAKLDFNARYDERHGGIAEIDELGHHMNELSDTLEETITQLKKANNELQQDIAKKEEIDEMRKDFLSNVTHELKTPLALIQGYAEGLRDGINDDPESQQFYCDVIVDEAGKMNQMIRKLLTLNQLEFGNDVPEMDRFDLMELIQGVINASSLLIATEKITLEFANDGPVYVWGDEFKVEEVMTNYLSNAIHYCLGEKIIRITLEEQDGVLRTSVFNTGNPIPEEDIDKVWIKFFKVDKARTREYGGSGIGLSIVKAIMDSMHQQCGVVNHEDGVEFWMTLECR